MISIRRGSREEAGAIAAVGVRSWREGFRGIVPESVDPERAWTADGVRERIETAARHGTEILVAELGGELCGFVVLGPCRDEDESERVGEIWALFVDPAAWRKGVGRRLVGAALAALSERGFAEATVWTLADSDRDVAFYEAVGFALDGATQRREPLGNPLEARLRRRLTPTGHANP